MGLPGTWHSRTDSGARASRTDASDAPKWHTRADRGELLKPHMRADGVLLAEGVAVKETVLEYSRPDGTVFRELVPLKTITDSAAGIAHLTLTLDHPDRAVHPTGVTRDNVRDLGVGNVGSDILVEDGGFTRVHLAIRRGDAIDAVQSGKIRELSLGYDAEVDPTPGVHAVHGKYDGVQVSRRYNHLALVDCARVGPDAAIRFDGVTTRCLDTSPTPGAQAARGARMDPELVRALSLLGLTGRYDSDAVALSAVTTELRRRKDAEEAMAEEAAAEEVAADAEKSALQAALDTAVQALAAAQAELDALQGTAAVEADKADRAALLPLATALKVDAAAHPKTRDLRKAIATAHFGGKLRADASDVYVDAVVDLALTAAASHQDGRKTGNDAWVQPQNQTGSEARSDGAPRLSPIQKAQAARTKRLAGGAA